jgi:hypothetical protein
MPVHAIHLAVLSPQGALKPFRHDDLGRRHRLHAMIL